MSGKCKDAEISRVFFGLETGPRLDPRGWLSMDPKGLTQGKTSRKSVVGVTGFEPATPTSRT